MRILLSVVVMSVAVGLLSAFVGCGGDGQPVHSVCRSFCPALVSAMDDSDWYEIKSTSEAEAACMKECTDSIEGVNDDLQDNVIDCVDCVGEQAGDNADWDDFMDAVNDDCLDECFDDDYPDDPNPWEEFYDDFSEDFDEHYSYGDGGGDADTDADCDTVAADCGWEYTDCTDLCGDDLDCLQACYDDFCWCIEDGGCDSSVYGC